MAENIENKDPLRLTPIPENGAVKTYERKKNVAASVIKETTLEISYDILDEVDIPPQEDEYSSGTFINCISTIVGPNTGYPADF